jgi:hypothetical protein
LPPWKTWQVAQSEATLAAFACAPPWQSRQRPISGIATSEATCELRTLWQLVQVCVACRSWRKRAWGIQACVIDTGEIFQVFFSKETS